MKKKIELNISDLERSRYWYNDEPIITHFFNSLSIGVTEIERFLVKTARLSLPDITEQPLRKMYKQFIDEEASHSLHHTKFNRVIEAQGYLSRFFARCNRRIFKSMFQHSSQQNRLALSVCLEHIGTTVSYFITNYNIFPAGVCPTYDFFRWHALEEIEHQHVASQVYFYFHKSRARLVFFMLLMAVFITLGFIVFNASLIFTDFLNCRFYRLKQLRKGLAFYFGGQGLIWFSIKSLYLFFQKIKKPTKRKAQNS